MESDNNRRRPKQLMMLRRAEYPPVVRLPEGWSVRPMRPDECETWAFIAGKSGFKALSGETPLEHWERLMGADPGVKTENVFFVCDTSEKPVATAAVRLVAESGRNRNMRYGYLHHVASLPEYRGRGAGTAVIATILRRFDELEIDACALTTDDHRMAAISIYLKMGWLPVLHAPDMRMRWVKVLSTLGIGGELAVYDENLEQAEPLRVEK